MRLVRCHVSAGGHLCWGVVRSGAVHRFLGDPLAGGRPGEVIGPLEEVRLLTPCRPGKVVALAANYRGATGESPEMTEPLVFLKAPNSVCGPGDDVVSPFPGARVWGEAELAIVVGSRLRRAGEGEAQAAIFGYTAANDVSADNVDGRDHHLARSKSADTFCPLGPWIDTDYSPAGRRVDALQNGELIRRGSTDDRVWSCARTLSRISSWMTLEPWDVVLTGTPPRRVPRRYLRPGDEFVVRIEGLGELKNRFRELGR